MAEDNAIKIFMKIGTRQLFGDDLEPFLEALKYFANKSEYVEDEIYGWEKIVQINLRDADNFFVKTDKPLTEHSKLVIEYGNVDSPDTTITTDSDTFTGIMCGRARSSAENPEKFKVEGDNSQTFIFFMLLMLIGQEFTEQARQVEKKRKENQK